MQPIQAEPSATSSSDAETRMIVHLFKLSSGSLYCVAQRRSGEDLPGNESGIWQYIRDVDLFSGEDRLEIDSASAIRDIIECGYHLVGGWYHLL